MRLKMWAKFVGAIIVLFALDAAMIFAPAFVPVPREGPKTAAQGATQHQQDCQDRDYPCPAPTAGNGQVQTFSKHDTAQQPRSANGQGNVGTVSVTSLPEVTVASDYKGWVKRWYDWGPWAFGFVVAVFSGFQVWLLSLTRGRVARQADLMNRQNVLSREALRIGDESAKAAKLSAEAAREQANHIVVSERAWVLASPQSTSPQIPQSNDQGAMSPMLVNVSILFENKGNTPAFIKKVATGGCAIPRGEIPDLVHVTQWRNIGKAIPVAPRHAFSWEHERIEIERAIKIRTGDLVLWVYGIISYDDIFERDERNTGFCFRWEPSSGEWVYGGTPDANWAK